MKSRRGVSAGLLEKLAVQEIFDRGGLAAAVGRYSAGYGPGTEFAEPGGQGARDGGDGGGVLGVYFAGEAYAVRASDAARPSLVGDRIDGHGNGERVPAQTPRGRQQQRGFGIERQRRHGVGLAAGRLERVGAGFAGDPDFPFGLGIERLQFPIGERPIRQRAAGRRAVGRLHAEVPLHVTPRHGAIAEGAAAHARRNIVIRALAGQDFAKLAIAGFGQPDAVLVVGPKSVSQHGGALVSGFGELLAPAAFQQNHAKAGQRQLFRHDAAGGSGADDYDIYGREWHSQWRWSSITPATPSIFQLASSRLPPCAGLP